LACATGAAKKYEASRRQTKENDDAKKADDRHRTCSTAAQTQERGKVRAIDMTRIGIESGGAAVTLPQAGTLAVATLVALTLLAWPTPGRAQLPGEEEAPPPPTNCAVSGFRAAVTDAPEGERNAKALEWLAQEGPKCSLDRWILIRNNRNQWMGSADSAKLAGVIDSKVEELAREDAGVINNLFTSPPPPAPKTE
jgi:hypothetical protein